MASSSQGQGPPVGDGETGQDTESETTIEKHLGKRREHPPSIPETQEEDSLSDRDADWEPEEETEVDVSSPGSAPKFAPPAQAQRAERGVYILSGADELRAPGLQERKALQENMTRPCQETCTRLSDLRRHQRPHFEADLDYAKDNLDEEAVAKAQAAIDKCAGRGQSYACEFCGKIYSRLDAVARHRQQPQGRQCNIAYKRMRAEERARAKDSQGAETEPERSADKDKDMEMEQEPEEGEHGRESEKEPGQGGKGKDKE
ncbi:hypothetical protein RSAG8_07417, partial [Rhizoctonia solani AG-8 WAC10335]